MRWPRGTTTRAATNQSCLGGQSGRPSPGLRVGTLALSQTFRNPALVAKAATTVQTLTDGRFVLGIGAGANESEHRAYGYQFAPPRERLAQLAEAAQIIKALWGTGPVSFSGTHYTVMEAFCEPRPVPPQPLMIAGMGERYALRVVAAHADWWNGDWCTTDDYARKLAILHQYCREIGRDPASITPTYYGWVSLSRDPARVTHRIAHGFGAGMHIIAGNADAVAREIEAFAARGVAHMQLHFVDHPATEGLELFLSEILPRFNR